MQIGDSHLRMDVQCGTDGVVEAGYTDLPGLRGQAWTADIDGSNVRPVGGTVRLSTETHAVIEGTIDKADWRLEYRVTGPGRITKTLKLTAKADLTLETVSLWNATSPAPPVVASTRLQDIAAFYRDGCAGLFASLDFPYSKITTDGASAAVSYPPHVRLRAGEVHTCESLTVGATQMTGIARYGFDEGEVEAMDSYIQERFPPRFDRPMFVTSCITNRHTQIDGDIIWYTMRDHPTLSFNLDILKREIALMEKLGMEYYQLFTGPFDSVPGDPDPAVVDDVVSYARSKHVRIGDYSACEALFCPHYNEYRNSLDNHPEWGIASEDACFGNPRFVDFYIGMVASTCRRYGYDLHLLDFLNIRPCDDPDHGHPLGAGSIYAQVKGLTRLLEAINEVSPDMMTWSNSGNWTEFLPKIAWANHNLYLTDPYIADPWQGLNMTRLLDDVRREQMVSLHYSRFVPYRFFTNCQYFFIQNSIVPDIRNYQYGALSTIAVTPNLSLCEIRPWIDRLSPSDQKEVIGFYKRWTDFLKAHYDLWTKTYHVGENPGMGSVEVYSHADGDHGFVFIVNPNYWDQAVEVPLDSSLGFSAEGKCEITELHPVERLRLTQQGPLASFGTSIGVRAPAQQVLVLEVRPARSSVRTPRVYGVPGVVKREGDGYLLKTSGPQGVTERFAIVLPRGSKPVMGVSVRDEPKQPKRLWAPTPVKLLAGGADGVMGEITFRRTPAPTELRDWRVRGGTLTDDLAGGFDEGEELRFPLFADVERGAIKLPFWDKTADALGLGPLANFCGGYIENAFGESQETWIELRASGSPEWPSGELTGEEIGSHSRALPGLALDRGTGWWLQTSFHLPFMYQIGAEPCPDDHTLLVLPFIRRPRAAEIRAWINGEPLGVRDYRYPRNRGLGCYYADLVGTAARGGENVVVIHYSSG